MQNQRDISNETNLMLGVTLYIQKESNINSIYGTINLTLKPGQVDTVEFGNLRNNTLVAIRICPLPVTPTETYSGQVAERADFIDRWLNNSPTIEITLEALQKLNNYSPFYSYRDAMVS